MSPLRFSLVGPQQNESSPRQYVGNPVNVGRQRVNSRRAQPLVLHLHTRIPPRLQSRLDITWNG